MALTQLDPQRWQPFFDQVSRDGERVATVEATGSTLGHRMVAEHSVMSGISYEPEGQILTLFLQGLEHRIRRPRSIHVDQEGSRLNSFEAIDGDEVHHIVQFETVPAGARGS